MTLIVVAAVLQRADAAVLLQRRPDGTDHAGLWEFPGGKVEASEALADALIRELHEELGIVVAAGDCVPIDFATEARTDGELLLLLYLCRCWRGEPHPVPGSALEWVGPNAIASWPMPPVDQPLAARLPARLAGLR